MDKTLKGKRGETATEHSTAYSKKVDNRNIYGLIMVNSSNDKHLKDLLDKHSTTMYSTENEEKSSVVERWIRTIKQRVWKQFTVQGNTVC